MAKTSHGIYQPKNKEKYIGTKTICWRSSWELQFMSWADNNPNIIKWASEPMRIPYRDPLTNKNTTYVPDFLIQYLDKSGKINTEIIEIKPQKHTLLEKVGKNKTNQLHYVKNMAKWQAATAFCKQQGIRFRVITEAELFHNGKG